MGEGRDGGDALASEPVGEGFVPSLGDVVHVLHRHDGCARLSFFDLICGGVADAEVSDHARVLQVGERLEVVVDLGA